MAKDNQPGADVIFTREDYSILSQGLQVLAASHKRRANSDSDASVREIYAQLQRKCELLNIKLMQHAPVNPAPHS